MLKVLPSVGRGARALRARGHRHGQRAASAAHGAATGPRPRPRPRVAVGSGVGGVVVGFIAGDQRCHGHRHRLRQPLTATPREMISTPCACSDRESQGRWPHLLPGPCARRRGQDRVTVVRRQHGAGRGAPGHAGAGVVAGVAFVRGQEGAAQGGAAACVYGREREEGMRRQVWLRTNVHVYGAEGRERPHEVVCRGRGRGVSPG